MKILIDALSARVGGGATYLANFLPALVRQSGNDRLYLLCSSLYQENFVDTFRGEVYIIDAKLSAGGLWKRWRYLQDELPQIIEEHEIDLLFTVAETGCVSATKCPKVTLVRNPNFFHAPGNVRTLAQRLSVNWYRFSRRPFVNSTLQAADFLIFVSGSFQETVNRTRRIAHKPQRVVYHGLSPIFSSDASPASPGRRYLLCVSSVVPHKNMECLIRAFGLLINDLGVGGLDLQIAGDLEDFKYQKFLRAIADEHNVESRVTFLGRVDYDSLPALYRGAVAFILPSTLETFGHPLVEAMASGVPVLASDMPLAREICEDGAIYFNPLDPVDLASKLRMVLEGGSKVDCLRESGTIRAKFFSWDKAAQETAAIFREISAEWCAPDVSLPTRSALVEGNSK